MSRLLMVTSALALFAAPAIAQDVEAPTRGGVDDRSTLRAPDETQVDIDGDGDLETLKNGYTDDHAWVDAPVYADGERIGEVERVHFEDQDQEIDRIVIETGGIADIGGREVEIPVEDARLMTDDDGETAFTLAMSAAELDALPEFDESKASDYPLSESPADEQGGRENERR